MHFGSWKEALALLVILAFFVSFFWGSKGAEFVFNCLLVVLLLIIGGIFIGMGIDIWGWVKLL